MNGGVSNGSAVFVIATGQAVRVVAVEHVHRKPCQSMMLRQMIRNLMFLGIGLSVAWHLLQAYLVTRLPH